jgi:N-acetylglucosaminyldiphosphoundecaprenol N-acetyl-beta-D-mannosaminyltransferase
MVEVLGVSIALLDCGQALQEIKRLVSRGEMACVYYVNAHVLNIASEDPEYGRILQNADLLLNDGIGVSLAARVNGCRFPTNLNGSDFNPKLLELAAEEEWKVYLLGGAQGVADIAARALGARIAGLQVVGTESGYFSPDASERIASDIARSGADVVVVAMGNPLQERWLHSHLSATGARLGVAAGAFLDYQAGVEKRAPRWMNRMGVEWVYRLARQPRRFWRRYLIGNPKFLIRILRARFRRNTSDGRVWRT